MIAVERQSYVPTYKIEICAGEKIINSVQFFKNSLKILMTANYGGLTYSRIECHEYPRNTRLPTISTLEDFATSIPITSKYNPGSTTHNAYKNPENVPAHTGRICLRTYHKQRFGKHSMHRPKYSDAKILYFFIKDLGF